MHSDCLESKPKSFLHFLPTIKRPQWPSRFGWLVPLLISAAFRPNHLKRAQDKKGSGEMLHSSLSHMRTYHCLDLSGPWRQQALMCTTFLYVQTHLTSQKEKALRKIKWDTKEKDKNEPFSPFALPSSGKDTMPGFNILTHAPKPGKSFIGEKLYFFIKELGTRHFKRTSF